MSGLAFVGLLLAVPPAAVAAIFVVHRRRTAARRGERETRFKALLDSGPARPTVEAGRPPLPGPVGEPVALITPPRYAPCATVLAQPGAELFNVLLAAFPDQLILTNVPLVELLTAGPSGADPQRDIDLQDLSVQFALCDRKCAPFAGVDFGHEPTGPIRRKAQYLEAAGLNYLFIRMAAGMPDAAALRTRLGKSGK